jgi:hypothetical protein
MEMAWKLVDDPSLFEIEAIYLDEISRVFCRRLGLQTTGKASGASGKMTQSPAIQPETSEKPCKESLIPDNTALGSARSEGIS